jgi:hypothetical protein
MDWQRGPGQITNQPSELGGTVNRKRLRNYAMNYRHAPNADACSEEKANIVAAQLVLRCVTALCPLHPLIDTICICACIRTYMQVGFSMSALLER